MAHNVKNTFINIADSLDDDCGEGRRFVRRARTAPAKHVTIFECYDEAGSGDEEQTQEQEDDLLAEDQCGVAWPGPPQKELMRTRTFDPFEEDLRTGTPSSTAPRSVSPTRTPNSGSPASASSSAVAGRRPAGQQVQPYSMFAGMHPGVSLPSALPTGVFWAIPMGANLSAPAGSAVLAPATAAMLAPAGATAVAAGAPLLAPQMVQQPLLVSPVAVPGLAQAATAAAAPSAPASAPPAPSPSPAPSAATAPSPRAGGNSAAANTLQRPVAERQQPPQTVAQELAADGSLRVKWTVDARKLRANEKAVISPPFEISTVECGVFRLILSPAPSRFRGGATFKNSCGKGSVQLKCETDANSQFSFRILIGDGRGRYEAARGPVHHNFAVGVVGGLPRHQQEWDFNRAVDTSTRTFVVCLEVL